MSKAIITISRQYGSGGRLIAQKLSEKLGIPFYDQALIDMAAKESGYEAELFEHVDEHTNNWFYNLSMFGNSTAMQDLPLNDKIFLAQSNVIRKVADQGPCVIVGRNADYILKDRPDALHTFIFADMAFRADRIVRLYGESDKSPEARLNEKDKRRRVNYQHYTGRTWGQSQNYHICLNSGILGIDQCVDIIVGAVENSKK